MLVNHSAFTTNIVVAWILYPKATRSTRIHRTTCRRAYFRYLLSKRNVHLDEVQQSPEEVRHLAVRVERVAVGPANLVRDIGIRFPQQVECPLPESLIRWTLARESIDEIRKL